MNVRCAKRFAVVAAVAMVGLIAGCQWLNKRTETARLPEVVEKPAATIAVDTTRTSTPISKYVYGQFIEHLGRCIYGGIWAEMLEDRKFFYSVPAPGDIWATEPKGGATVLVASPWKVVGRDGSVAMVTQDVYVGDHTPEITLPGDGNPTGIAQDDLGLVKGKKYTGRIILAGDPGAAPVEVTLVWGRGEHNRMTVTVGEITGDYRSVPFSFKSEADTDNGRLEIVALGEGKLRIGTVSLMPADNINGMRADTLELLKELNSPVYRWPGGNFVSGYEWLDGTGERDRRPPRKNPAWTGVEHNDFGLHEFMVFCEELGTEPFVAVNTGSGTAESARLQVEYCNGSVDTEMGALRAENGSAEPFNIKWWAVGNEMYGGWQIGHMPVEQYVKKHNSCVDAMRQADPSVKFIAVGNVLGKWSEQMFAHCSDHMDLISEHFYCRPQNLPPIKHVAMVPERAHRIIQAHRDHRRTSAELDKRDIRIAMDEWNYWHKPYVPEYGELGCRYTLKDALGIAAGLHEFFRNSDMVFMANYAQTVNVIGCIKTSKTEAAFATTGLVLKLYRNEFGEIPVRVTGFPKPLDVVAAMSGDHKKITVGIVNPTGKNISLGLNLWGPSVTGTGKRWVITGNNPLEYNEPGRDPKVAITERAFHGFSDVLTAEPVSVTLYALDVE